MNAQNTINHIALVLDASTSMAHLKDAVVKVANAFVKQLAETSKAVDIETRVTVYTFADDVQCAVYDKDVLRLPDIKDHYRAQGYTALVDATWQAIDDLSKTAQLYGKHDFLVYVLTDGEDNRSDRGKIATIASRIAALPENWTFGALVPDAVGMQMAKRFGLTNAAIWDATSVRGMEAAGDVIRQTADAYVRRAPGVRGFKNIFEMRVDNLDRGAVRSQCDKLGPGQFRMWTVTADEEGQSIAELVERKTRRSYVLGEAFYELMSKVTVQPQKDIALYEKKDHTVWTGAGTRQMLKLPRHDVKVGPQSHPDFSIFIQSTSVNRKLLLGQRVMVLSR